MKTRFSSAWAAPGAMSATAAAHAEASRIRKTVRVTRAIVVSTCWPRCPHVRQALQVFTLTARFLLCEPGEHSAVYADHYVASQGLVLWPGKIEAVSTWRTNQPITK